MTTFYNPAAIHAARPFAGQGASLYLTAGGTVVYRQPRLQPRGGCLANGWDGRDPKTLRVAVLTGVTGDELDFAYDLSALPAGTYTADVRHFRDDVENLTENTRAVRFTLDGGAAELPSVGGAATLVQTTLSAGGNVALTFRYQRPSFGTLPETLTLARTAGPTSPTAVGLVYDAALDLYTFAFAGLDDSFPYTFALTAAAGAVSTVLLSGISVQVDATGPAAPTLVSAAPV